MLKTASLSMIFSAALALGFAGNAHADININVTLPNYDGTVSFGPFPAALSIGPFTFAIPAGEHVVGGTISGTFGNNDVPGTTSTSAPADLYVGGIVKVAACDDSLSYSAACDSGPGPTPFTYTFTPSDLSNLAPDFASGALDFSALQNGVFTVNAGSVNLDIQAAPEPNYLFLLGGAMAGLFLLRRHRFN